MQLIFNFISIVETRQSKQKQLESKAHIEVQKCIAAHIEDTPGTVITSKSFLCWIHKEFYERMPEEYLDVQRADGKLKR